SHNFFILPSFFKNIKRREAEHRNKHYPTCHKTEPTNPSNMKNFLVLLLVVPSIFAFAPSHVNVAPNNNHKILSTSSTAIFSNVADVKAAFKQNPQKTFLLDVREPDEWAEAHLSLATPSPLSKLTSGKWMDNKTGIFYPGTFPIDRFTGVSIVLNTNIFVHCKMGGRAKQAVELLQQMGYKNAVALEETFDELAAAEICDVVGGEIQGLTD
ncbi:MAG: rhodanese-related sulfurtransferase, partial [Bacillariaceae sp.]